MVKIHLLTENNREDVYLPSGSLNIRTISPTYNEDVHFCAQNLNKVIFQKHFAQCFSAPKEQVSPSNKQKKFEEYGCMPSSFNPYKLDLTKIKIKMPMV